MEFGTESLQFLELSPKPVGIRKVSYRDGKGGRDWDKINLKILGRGFLKREHDDLFQVVLRIPGLKQV